MGVCLFLREGSSVLLPHLRKTVRTIVSYDTTTTARTAIQSAQECVYFLVEGRGCRLHSSSTLSQKLGPRLIRMFIAPLFPIMLQNLVQQTRGFTCAAHNPFNNRRARQLLTTTGGFSPAISSRRDYANTSFKPRGRLFSSTTDDNGVIPITVLSGFLGR